MTEVVVTEGAVIEVAPPSPAPSVVDIIEAEESKAVAVIEAEAAASVERMEASAASELAIIEARKPSEELEGRVNQCEQNVAELTIAVLGETGLLSVMAAKISTLETQVLTLLALSTPTPPLIVETPPPNPPPEEGAVLPEAVIQSPPPPPAKKGKRFL